VESAWYRHAASGFTGALKPVAAGVQIDAQTVQFTLGALAPREGIETRVQFPHGAIAAPPPAWQAAADRADWLAQTVAPIGDFVALLLTIGVLAGGGGFLFLLWFSNGREPAIRPVALRLTQPPSDLPAPLAGTLADGVASAREAVATLVDLADRGIVHLTDEQNPQLVGSQSDVRVTLNAGLDDRRLRGYERVLLAALFGRSPSVPAEVLLSNVKSQFQVAIPIIEERLYAAVAQERLFAGNPETTRRRWRIAGVGISIAGTGMAVVAEVLLANIINLAWLPGLALALVGGCLAWLAGSMSRRTAWGALEAAKWRAFGKYLAEESRAEKPGTALPPHYLPYAIAFGLDESFVRHLESVGTPPPTWYGRWSRGPGGMVFGPGGWYGGPWMDHSRHNGAPGQPHTAQPDSGGVAAPPAPSPQGWSDALAALLNAASEAMAHGGGSGGWSGGGFGGGGGGGGGSGGFR
jgi:hypothetical protein